VEAVTIITPHLTILPRVLLRSQAHITTMIQAHITMDRADTYMVILLLILVSLKQIVLGTLVHHILLMTTIMTPTITPTLLILLIIATIHIHHLLMFVASILKPLFLESQFPHRHVATNQI
jgi:hypothetical protein